MAQAKAKKEIREDGNGVNFNFSNGEVLECTLDSIPEEVQKHLMLHGLSQKVGDSYAGMDTVEECLETASAMFERLVKGEWTAARQSSGTPKTSQLFEALVRCMPNKSAEEIQTLLENMDDEKKKALKKHAQVAAAIAEIQAERAAEKAKKAAEAAQEDGGSLDI